ncbi:MAG: CDP-alcohol phosphatidyltransferase family protein [Granulosicoccaceae bacterium]
MSDIEGRRPLKVRDVKMSQSFARALAQKNITPNHISMASVVFALFAAICLWNVPSDHGNSKVIFLLLAAVFIQCRLLCNLFDGMVAIEGGKSTASGELFNDIPDRVADPIILIVAGSVSSLAWAGSVGWLAALLAVGTAYTRTLGKSIGTPSYFEGPMAKQHRMAIITIACVLSVFEHNVWPSGTVLLVALVVICSGSVITIIRRARLSYLFLESTGE